MAIFTVFDVELYEFIELEMEDSDYNDMLAYEKQLNEEKEFRIMEIQKERRLALRYKRDY